MAKSEISELKELEKEMARIQRRRARLEERLKAKEEASKWYSEIYAESGCKTPRSFLKALMAHFGINSVSLDSGSGAAGPEGSGGGKRGRKPRTPITPDVIRDVKEFLKTASMNQAAVKFGVSNPTIRKIRDGFYDA